MVSEAYLQWVLEDRFANGRPRLEEVAVPVQLETRPVAVRIQFTTQVRRNPRDPASLLAVTEIFGEQIAANGRVAAAVDEALEAIERLGVRDALAQPRAAR